jgi:hypothetical protein
MSAPSNLVQAIMLLVCISISAEIPTIMIEDFVVLFSICKKELG